MSHIRSTTIDYCDLGIEYADCGPWRSYELNTTGETIEEMRENATVSEVDQDGGELHSYGYDDCLPSVAKAVDTCIEHHLGRTPEERAEALNG